MQAQSEVWQIILPIVATKKDDTAQHNQKCTYGGKKDFVIDRLRWRLFVTLRSPWRILGISGWQLGLIGAWRHSFVRRLGWGSPSVANLLPVQHKGLINALPYVVVERA